MTVLEDAIGFATKMHSGQRRKFSGTPYILHPFEVASIIATMTDDENVMAAGILHDTIEDCDADPNEIRSRFGPIVSALVQSESEDKLSDKPPEETWKERKADSILFLQHTKNLQVKILWLADKLSNIRSFYREYLKNGNEIWNHLHQKDPQMHQWYYQTIADYTSELKDTAAYQEYIQLIHLLFESEDKK